VLGLGLCLFGFVAIRQVESMSRFQCMKHVLVVLFWERVKAKRPTELAMPSFCLVLSSFFLVVLYTLLC